jgi:hypothetical protein
MLPGRSKSADALVSADPVTAPTTLEAARDTYVVA